MKTIDAGCLGIAFAAGAPALSFPVMPTKAARGSGVVAFGEF